MGTNKVHPFGCTLFPWKSEKMSKVNGTVIFGALVFVIGMANIAALVKSAQPSPLDVVDDQTEQDGFIPILQQVGGQDASSGEPFEYAPTLTDQVIPAEEFLVTGVIPDRLVIPSIFLDTTVISVHYKDVDFGGTIYHQWRVPAEFAAGWQDESALLGVAGNTVLNGHHNAFGEVFKDLVELKVGDEILVYAGMQEFRYRVAAKMLLPERGQPLEIRQENARWLAASEDERLTLVTCWPADSNTHRVIIVAFPIK